MNCRSNNCYHDYDENLDAKNRFKISYKSNNYSKETLKTYPYHN